MRKAAEEGNHSILLERKSNGMARDGDEERDPKARGLTQIIFWVAHFDNVLDHFMIG